MKILVAKTQDDGQHWTRTHDVAINIIVTRPDHLRGVTPSEVFYTLDAAFNRYFIDIEDAITARLPASTS